MDIFQRRKMLKELGKPNPDPIDLAKWEFALKGETPIEGEVEKLVKADVSGRKIQGEFRGQKVTYWVPSDAAWASGKGITIERAYRIVSEDENTMEVRQVYSDQFGAVKQGYMQEMRRILDKNK